MKEVGNKYERGNHYSYVMFLRKHDKIARSIVHVIIIVMMFLSKHVKITRSEVNVIVMVLLIC